MLLTQSRPTMRSCLPSLALVGVLFALLSSVVVSGGKTGIAIITQQRVRVGEAIKFQWYAHPRLGRFSAFSLADNFPTSNRQGGTPPYVLKVGFWLKNWMQ